MHLDQVSSLLGTEIFLLICFKVYSKTIKISEEVDTLRYDLRNIQHRESGS